MNQKINTTNNKPILRPFPSDRIGKAAKENHGVCVLGEPRDGGVTGSCFIFGEYWSPRKKWSPPNSCPLCENRLEQIGKAAKAKQVKYDQCNACGAWFEFKSAHKCDRLILALVRSAERKLKKGE